MKYEIKIRKKAQKALSKIPPPFQANIIKSIQKLAENPFSNQTKKLTGREAWRIRIGNYRVIYEVIDNELVILVLNIGHRQNVYKK